jgi:hypothetical protein
MKKSLPETTNSKFVQQHYSNGDKTMNKILPSILILAGLICSGCSTTGYKSISKNEPHAVIKGDFVDPISFFAGKRTHTLIKEIDEKRTKHNWSLSFEPKDRVPLGQHTIIVQVGGGDHWYYDRLELTCDRQIVYQIQTHIEDNKHIIKVINEETEEILAEEPLDPIGEGRSITIFI